MTDAAYLAYLSAEHAIGDHIGPHDPVLIHCIQCNPTGRTMCWPTCRKCLQ